MATQSVEFTAPPNQTLTVRLFAAGSDTIVATAGTVTAATNRAGLYTADFTDVPAGRYRLIATNAAGTPLATWWTDLTLTTATFDSYEMPISLVQTIGQASIDQIGSDFLAHVLTKGSPGTIENTLWKISKTNASAEGQVDDATPTASQFTTNLTGVDDQYNHQVLVWTSGSLTGEARPIEDCTESGGVLTLIMEEPFTAAPADEDEFLILPQHVHSIDAIQAGLATLANQTIIAGYLDTEITAIKSVTDKLNTGLVQDGGVYQFTANMLELAPAGGGGGGGSGDATEANQELILDQLDLIQAKTDLIGNAAALVAVASLQPGTISSFPETLRAGDSYTTENGRAITVQLLDTNGDPIEQSGSLLFTDAVVEFKIRRSSETDSSRIIVGTAEVTNPAGTGENQGPYVTIELASEETAKGIVKYRYTGLLTFTWPGTSDEVVSFETGQVTFND